MGLKPPYPPYKHPVNEFWIGRAERQRMTLRSLIRFLLFKTIPVACETPQVSIGMRGSKRPLGARWCPQR
jgi:hypothetical protein